MKKRERETCEKRDEDEKKGREKKTKMHICNHCNLMLTKCFWELTTSVTICSVFFVLTEIVFELVILCICNDFRRDGTLRLHSTGHSLHCQSCSAPVCVVVSLCFQLQPLAFVTVLFAQQLSQQLRYEPVRNFDGGCCQATRSVILEVLRDVRRAVDMHAVRISFASWHLCHTTRPWPLSVPFLCGSHTCSLCQTPVLAKWMVASQASCQGVWYLTQPLGRSPSWRDRVLGAAASLHDKVPDKVAHIETDTLPDKGSHNMRDSEPHTHMVAATLLSE